MIPNKLYEMLLNVLPMVVLFTLVMIFIRVISSIYARKKIVVYKEIKNLLTIVYLFVLFWLVTTTDFESYSNNFVPFKEILRYDITSVLFYRNVIGNILLFIPFGYIVTNMIYEKANKVNLFISLLVITLSSLSIEIIQMFIGRSFDVDDILLNLLGGIIGFIVFKILNKMSQKIKSENIKLILYLLLIIILAIVFLVCYGVM